MQTSKPKHITPLQPTGIMARSRKGMAVMAPVALVLTGALLLGGGMYFAGGDDGGDSTQQPQKAQVTADADTQQPSVDPETKDATSCDGIASTSLEYDDLDQFNLGTDPDGNMTIFQKGGEGFIKTVQDDGSASLPTLSSFTALAGNTQGDPHDSYFAKEVTFDTVCSDINQQTRLSPASKPTMTIVNNNGIQQNSDSNHEDVSADSDYNPYVLVKSDSDACAAQNGAVVAFEYNSDYVKSIDSSTLVSSASQFLVDHETNYSGTGKDMDQFKVMQFDGSLCDGEDKKIYFDVETTSTSPGEDEANVKVHWYPTNKDLNAKTYELLEGIYDEENNIISVGNTTEMYYTG